MAEDYFSILEANRDQMIRTLQESVRIPSEAAEPARNVNGEILPFGAEVDAAFQHMLETGKSMGFDVLDVDHTGGHIEWKADGAKETFGIASHLDVVPAGKGWTEEPYSGLLKDGYIYGRGTTDDKGPAVACLYAMKALKDAGLHPKRNIRLILGLDEETGSRSIEQYLEAAGAPDLGITPDGEFPLINGEMGILVFELAERMQRHSKKEGLVLSSLKGGDAYNIVPGYARAVVASSDPSVYDTIRGMAERYSEESGFRVKARKVGSSMSVEAFGLSAHGAVPERGINAVSILMAFLGKLSFAGDEVSEFIDFYNERIGFSIHGEKLGCALSDDVSGPLILNAGVAEMNSEVASVSVNIRYPVKCSSDQVYQAVENALEGTDIGLVKHFDEPPIYVPPDDPFAKQLMHAYIDETGDIENGPKVDSGGTYAKSIPGTYAFGALFPGEEDRMHQADERLLLTDFWRMSRIYARMLFTTCFE